MNNAIDTTWSDHLTQAFSKVRANRVARNAVTTCDVMGAARDISRMRTYADTYGVSIPKVGSVTNQRQSGRCWLFATYNVARQEVMRALDVENFELSQAYGMFYDKLEKANSMLARIIETAALPADDRLVAELLDGADGDGGYHTWAQNLMGKWGVVPVEAMPETACSKNSDQMDQQLARLLHRDALELRRMVAEGADDDAIDERKAQMLADVHRMLCVCLGEPPLTFDLEIAVGEKAKVDEELLSPIEPLPEAEEPSEKDEGDKDKDAPKPRRMLRIASITPQDFLERFVGIDPAEYVELISIPSERYPYGRVYHLAHTDSVLGGLPTNFLNVAPEVLEDAAIASLRDGKPVAMACDVAQEFPRRIEDFKHVLGTDTMDFEAVFGCDLTMPREDMVEIRETALTHEMTFQGVQLGEDGRPGAWRVENSWGKDSGKDGYLVMSGDWFRTYGGQVSVRRKYVSEELLALWDAGATEEVEPWSAMGAALGLPR